jgi:4-amino-4-deoxy-L-arabinose transferase-like glycosyltransferase
MSTSDVTVAPDLRRYWRWAWLFVAVLVLAHTLVRCLLYRNLDVDEAEQLVLIQKLALGYSAQPPLYTWLVWGMAQVVGANVVALAAVKALLMLTLFYQMMQLGRWCFADYRAILVFFVPLLLPLYAWEAWRMTHTPVLTILCLATVLAWLRLSRSPSWFNYAFLGCCFGLGMLTKYNYALFAGSIGLVILLLPSMRRLILSPGFLLSLLVGLLIVLPHAWWALSEQQAIMNYLRSRTGSSAHSISAFEYLQRVGYFYYTVMITGGIPIALIMLLDWKVSWKIRWPAAVNIQFLLLTIAIGMSLYIAAIFTVRMYHFRGHWLGPFLLLLPVWLISYVPAMNTWHRPAQGYLMIVALTSLVILGVRGSGYVMGYHEGKFQTRDYLFSELAEELQQQGVQLAEIIAGDIHCAGYLRLYFGDVPVQCSSFLNTTPVLSTGRITVVVWDATPEKGLTTETPQAFQQWFKEQVPAKEVKRLTTKDRPFHTRTTRLGYWVSVGR